MGFLAVAVFSGWVREWKKIRPQNCPSVFRKISVVLAVERNPGKIPGGNCGKKSAKKSEWVFPLHGVPGGFPLGRKCPSGAGPGGPSRKLCGAGWAGTIRRAAFTGWVWAAVVRCVTFQGAGYAGFIRGVDRGGCGVLASIRASNAGRY